MKAALPNGWARTTLGQLLSDLQPGFASGKHSSDGIGLPHLRPMNISRDGKIDRSDLRCVAPELAGRPARRLRRGDVLFNNTNSLELVGKTALFDDGDAPAFSNHMTRLRLHEGAIEPTFIAQLLQSRWRSGDFQRLANNHVSQASVGRNVLVNLPVDLPPIAEQRRITVRLDEIDSRRAATVACLRGARRDVDRFRSALLASACSGRLTAEWREDNARSATDELSTQPSDLRRVTTSRRQDAESVRGLTSEAQLALLPDTWSLVRLGDIVEVRTGATPLRNNRAYYEDGTIPWVTSGAVNAGTITVPTELITPLALAETSVKLFPPGTLLVAMYGEGQTRGRVGELAIEAGTNQAVAAVLFGKDTAPLQPYIRLFFEDSYQRVRALSIGGVQPNLNLGMIKDTLIPLPPVDEQREIVRRTSVALGTADRLVTQIEQTVATLDRVSKVSVMKAFRGALVPNEAELAAEMGRDFESADDLLAQTVKEEGMS